MNLKETLSIQNMTKLVLIYIAGARIVIRTLRRANKAQMSLGTIVTITAARQNISN